MNTKKESIIKMKTENILNKNYNSTQITMINETIYIEFIKYKQNEIG